MSFRPLLRSRTAASIATTAVAGGIVLYPRNTLHAETAEGSHSKRPIYDDDEILSPSPTTPQGAPTTTRPSTRPKPTSPTPTDRLAVQIGKTRIFLQARVAAAETKVNSWMDSALHLESSFTSTIASLAPPRESGEKLMPGAIYVLVAAMAGSIVTRNRNVLLRAAVPLAVGIGAGWVVLPITMRNVSDLTWKYEERFPAIAEGHLRTKRSIMHAWEMSRFHAELAASKVDEKFGEAREAAEGWVRKGK